MRSPVREIVEMRGRGEDALGQPLGARLRVRGGVRGRGRVGVRVRVRVGVRVRVRVRVRVTSTGGELAAAS